MTLFDWIRIALGVPLGLALIGLIFVLVEDIKYKK